MDFLSRDGYFLYLLYKQINPDLHMLFVLSYEQYYIYNIQKLIFNLIYGK